jgi:cyclase
MIQTRVIPALLLHHGGLVKTIRFADPRYVGDPINCVRIFNEKEVDELIFLDISATSEGRGPDLEQIRDIASECFMPFAYGGGIRSVSEVEAILKLGAEKVVINSAAFENEQLLRQTAQRFGSQCLVVCLEVKRTFSGKHELYSRRGTVKQRASLTDYVRRLEDLGAGEIFVNDVDRDGTGRGYDLALVRAVSDITSLPVIACGGAGSLQDLRLAATDGKASAVAAGSLFVFHGKHRAVLITYPAREELQKHLP